MNDLQESRLFGGEISKRANKLLADQFAAINHRTDDLFAVLMVLQWVAGICAAAWIAPHSWVNAGSETATHLWVALVLGGCVTGLPVGMVLLRPGSKWTRHVIAASQMTWSALLIQLTGGRAETHFHVLGSLALLACYRDWRVLLTATSVVVLDHFFRGMFWPQSVYGSMMAEPYRVLEHAGWILFEDTFLAISIRQSVAEMADIATKQARLERTNEVVEAEVRDQTRELHVKTEKLLAARRTLEAQAAALELQAHDLHVARASAEAANRAKSEFLANMSHEIRTPMTAVLGYADVLLASLERPENVKAATTIKRNGEYLLEIINDILDLSKIEAGKLAVERIRCQPEQIVSDVTALMKVRSDAKGLSLVVEYESDLPETILSDPTRIRQILLNLLGNAIKFSDRGEIRVRTGLVHTLDSGSLLRFEIIDQGIGITLEQVSKLFAPFTQADASTARRFGGTGLGLTISKRLAEMLGGRIWVESVAGGGSTFGVTVATGALEGVRMLSRPQESPASERATKTLTGAVQLDCRILLVDDSPDNQDLVSFVLQKSGAEVEVADNGAVAVDLALAAAAAGTPFDVILMDMQMPVLDGYGASRQLRASGYAGVIIALTAHAMSDDLEKCLAAGCDDYATKPIDGRLLELVARYAHGRIGTDRCDS